MFWMKNFFRISSHLQGFSLIIPACAAPLAGKGIKDLPLMTMFCERLEPLE
jgi:hypothetical protein